MKNKTLTAITKLIGPETKKTVKKMSTNGKLFSVPLRLLFTVIWVPCHLSIAGPAM
jgi:hypothetical protein